MKFSIGNPYRSRPILTLFSISVLLPAIFLFYQAYIYLHSSLPNYQDVIVKTGLQQQVVISKDQYGIPSIKAKTDQDAFFAVGYMHAQDRLWQLELQRRMAQGRLSEVFGKSASGFDIYIRTLRIYNTAIESLPALSPAAQESLQAYADGINSWLAQAKQLPLEFTLLDIKPEPWQPADSLAWVKMFGLSMSGNFQEDLNRLMLTETLGKAKVNTLYGVDSKQQVAAITKAPQDTMAVLAQLSQLSQDLHSQWNFGGKHIGSNAWVVAAQHSKNGRAILANDPHLNMELPSMWYIVDVQGEHFHTTGMSMVGSPLVMLGRNKHIAWGATNMLADTMDLYFEQINPQNTNQYRRGDQWLDFNIRTELIKVKADFPAFLREPLEPLKIQIRETDHGPVISDLISEIRQPLSLRWVGGQIGDTSFEAFYRLIYAHDWDSFNDALSFHRSPAMNLFYIDQKDNIGYLGTGDIPIRGRGNGSIPVPGWDPEYTWSGFIPKNEMPVSLNPSQGYLLSANNQVTNSTYPYFISEDCSVLISMLS
ncbi:MAG: penicillin acylase family protein [Paraglaciecola sp.]|nr:penicillin acylase family protein [Paraglaciecola sp.]